MDYEIKKSKLILLVDEEEMERLAAEDPDDICRCDFECDFLDTLISNSELTWVQPEECGDLTDAPMLGLRDELGRVEKRWAFMDYQVVGFLEELRDKGSATFVS